MMAHDAQVLIYWYTAAWDSTALRTKRYSLALALGLEAIRFTIPVLALVPAVSGVWCDRQLATP